MEEVKNSHQQQFLCWVELMIQRCSATAWNFGLMLRRHIAPLPVEKIRRVGVLADVLPGSRSDLLFGRWRHVFSGLQWRGALLAGEDGENGSRAGADFHLEHIDVGDEMDMDY